VSGAGLHQALGAEWIKLRSVRSTAWSLVAGFGLMLALTALVCASSTTEGGSPGHPGDNDIVRDSLAGVWLGQIPFVLLAVLAIATEYSTGMIRTTFAANPRRWATVTSKSVLVGSLVLLTALLASAASFVLGQSLLRGNGFNYQGGYDPVTLSDGPALRAVVGTALYLTALALLALGIAAIVRGTATAISLVLGLVFVPVMVSGVLPERAGELVQELTPTAGLASQQTVDRSDAIPIGPWSGLGVAFAYAFASLVVALWLARRRDA
jgi:ABC-2 type transport system permease protein